MVNLKLTVKEKENSMQTEIKMDLQKLKETMMENWRQTEIKKAN